MLFPCVKLQNLAFLNPEAILLHYVIILPVALYSFASFLGGRCRVLATETGVYQCKIHFSKQPECLEQFSSLISRITFGSRYAF